MIPKYRFSTHPGIILKEFMVRNEISIDDLAKATGLCKEYITRLISGDDQLTEEAASKLAIFFKVSEEFWLQLNLYHVASKSIQKSLNNLKRNKDGN